jgi:hypothetical protein
MVGSGSSSVENLQAALVAVGGTHDDILELRHIEQARAGAGDE